ncbi:MAG: hypothetical protein PHE83_19225, partial [Opitutaceae bacterium]|nr:hypothetical protein [Opitutaceae bacterium]
MTGPTGCVALFESDVKEAAESVGLVKPVSVFALPGDLHKFSGSDRNVALTLRLEPALRALMHARTTNVFAFRAGLRL